MRPVRDLTRHGAHALLPAVLLGCASLWVPPAASGAPQPSGIAVLQQQLRGLQARVRALAQENRVLREHQVEEERELGRLRAQARAQGAASRAPPAVPGSASATVSAPAGNSASVASPSPADGGSSALALPAPAGPVSSALPLPAPAGAAAPADLSGPAAGSPGLRLWGYGEIYYSRPTASGKTEADLARAVLGVGYGFDERTEFNSEYEVEHAVSSASDVGEVEVEQFYVDRQFGASLAARAGLLLMPFGLLNEHHEPTNFYGMQRNFIETLIIPSTWREGGIALYGNTGGGFGWNAGLTSGFDLSKWDFSPQFPPYTTALDLEASGIAPLQATHQELSRADARHLSPYVSLGWYGVPGLSLGAAVTSGDAVAAPGARGSAGVTLWEAHARWMPGRWDLSALYARGTLGNTAAANAAHPDAPNPIPSAFYGYFFQGAWRLWERGDYRAAPFVRWERYDMGAAYAGTAGPVLPAGLVPLSGTSGDVGLWPRNHDRAWTVGANFYIGPHVVLKGDYQWFAVNETFTRLDLGLGVAF